MTSKLLTSSGVLGWKARAAAIAAAVVVCTVPAHAQLDPLLFLKRIPPNVLLAIDMRTGMLNDLGGTYYDPDTYTWSNSNGDLTWQNAIGLVQNVNVNRSYHRTYKNFQYISGSVPGFTYAYTADSIATVGDLSSGFATTSFYAPTRLVVARTALKQVINENSKYARFGLLKMRQASPTWGAEKNGNIHILDPNEQTNTESTPKNGTWYVTRPTVSANNGSITSVQAPLVKADSGTATTDILNILNKDVGSSTSGGVSPLIPAGNTTSAQTDAPLEYMLDDIRSEANRLIGLDTSCRNTVAVLVVAGGEPANSTAASHDPATKASAFKNLSGRRVPIYVVALAPPAADVAQLQAIAANSGGQYFQISKANVDAALAAGTAVPQLVAAATTAIQAAFERYSDFNPTNTNAGLTSSEFQVTSPIVGTVNLVNALSMAGSSLPNTNIVNQKTSAAIPQRSDVMVTTAFTIPGFNASLRAFRMYQPVSDMTQPTTYKFASDGTPLWVACAPGTVTTIPGTSYASPCASLSTDSRNLYTVLPNGTTVAFTTANAAALAPYLSGATVAPASFDAAGLISYVRNMPLGAVVSSTPAMMDPPSLDPPPDADYPTFITNNKDRRSIVWVGASDGMLHAIDARLGIEVWGFIPFNLLPKLKTLLDGQPPAAFAYFMDGSPKVADVKVGGSWKTYLICGEGAGGTFYQAFDVTLAGMSSTVSPTDNNIASFLSYLSDGSKIPFVWSFPRYSSFDYTIQTAAMPYGDVSVLATPVEKTVGQTWSDPAVGQVKDATGKYVAIIGSGFFPYTPQTASNRGNIVAGTSIYLIDVSNGTVLDSKDVGSDGASETVDDCAAAGNCSSLKNALQADPVATGSSDSRFITESYIGDLDGRVWRLDIGTNGSNATVFTSSPLNVYNTSLVGGHGGAKKAGSTQPIFSSMATVNVGGTQQYIFLGTGSDLLPSVGVNQSYQLIGFLDNAGVGVQEFTANLTAVAGGTANEEKVTAFPAVAGDIVFFSTTTFKPQSPCSTSDANLYALTYIGGPAYDTDGDGSVGNNDTTKVKTVMGGRSTAPFIVDQHLVFGTGTNVAIFGDSQDYNNGVGQAGVRILSWREIR